MGYVYGEVVLVENFLINFIILKVTSSIMKRKTRRWQLALSALIGAVYSLMQYAHPVFTQFPFKVMLSVLIILIGFSPIRLRDFTNHMLIFYGISLLFGGCVIGLIILGNKSANMTLTIYGVRSTTVMIGIFIGIITIIKIRELIVDVKLKSNSTMEICIYLHDKKLFTKGFIDTGCNVVEPLTGKPVLLAEYDTIKKILPEEFIHYYDTYDGIQDTDIESKIHNTEILKRIRFIPFNTVSTDKNEKMLGYQFDKVELGDGQKWQEVEKVCVGICKRNLCEDYAFQALINPKLLYMSGGL